MGTQGIQVGDAVLKFLADTTDVDRGFASIGPKARAAMGPANDALEEVQDNLDETGKRAEDAGDGVEDAGKRTAVSMREAKGEVALLGEEFGIRLPRHVRSFVAELPGVAPALSAAFSATAVLFLLEALAKGTEKLSEWIGAFAFGTAAAKEFQDQLTKENHTIIELNKIQDEAKKKIEELTGAKKSDVEVDREHIAALKQGAEAELVSLKAQIASRSWLAQKTTALKDVIGLTLSQLIPSIEYQTQAEKDQIAIEHVKGAILNTNAQAAKASAEVEKEAAIEKQQAAIKAALATLENDKKVAMASAQTEQEKYNLTQFYEQKKLQLLKELGTKEMQQAASLAADIEAQQQEHSLKMQEIAGRMVQDLNAAFHLLASDTAIFSNANRGLKVGLQETDEALMGPHLTALKKLSEATQELGIKTKDELVADLAKAQQALITFAQSGSQDVVALHNILKAVEDNQTALNNYGLATNKFKLESKGMWAEFQREAKEGATAMQLVKQSGVTAFDDLSKNIEGAFSNIALGQGNVAKELEKATASSLASIASQAAVKAIYYTAEGFAALGGFEPQSAASYFTAAGEMATVAGVAGVAARVMSNASGGPGGNGSGTNPSQLQNGQSNTSGSGSRGTVGITGVQGHADGALIMSPILSTFAENGPEAAIPLNDPRAMGHIGKAVADAMAAHGGGGGGTTVHVHGHVIGANDVAHLVGQINKRVARGQASLLSSNTLRITKRSA
jgi:hypothetical protein